MPQHEAVFDMTDTPQASASRDRLGRIARLAGVRIPGATPDGMLSRRAAMNRLPITADPAMWSDEQIIEVLSTPLLIKRLQEDQGLLAKVLEQADKRNLRERAQQAALQQLQQKRNDPEWSMPDTGWYLVIFNTVPLGFAKGEPHAAEVVRRLLNRVEQGEFPFNADALASGIEKEALRELRQSGNRVSRSRLRFLANDMRMDPEDMAREFIKHPLHGKKRRAHAEQLVRTIKAPDDMEPPVESRIAGNKGTPQTVDASLDALAERSYDKEDEDGFVDDKFLDEVKRVDRENQQAVRGIARELAAPLVKKVKWAEEHRKEAPDFEKMVDDATVVASASLNRILRLAIVLDDAGDAEGVEALSKQLDLYAERSMKRAHMAPSKETRTPAFWKPNMDYAGYEGSPWRGSMSEFKKRFKSLGDFLKWRRKMRNERDRIHKLESVTAPIVREAQAQAMKDAHTLLTMFNCIDLVRYGGFRRENHYVPEGGDDVNKLGDKEPKLWSDNPKHKDIEGFLEAFRKHHGNDADDEQVAFDAAREFVEYWKLLLKKPKKRKRRK